MSRYIALVDGKTGAYGVVFPDLPGCTAMGKTMDEAVSNAAEALRDWVEVTEENGGKISAASQPRGYPARSGGKIRACARRGACSGSTCP